MANSNAWRLSELPSDFWHVTPYDPEGGVSAEYIKDKIVPYIGDSYKSDVEGNTWYTVAVNGNIDQNTEGTQPNGAEQALVSFLFRAFTLTNEHIIQLQLTLAPQGPDLITFSQQSNIVKGTPLIDQLRILGGTEPNSGQIIQIHVTNNCSLEYISWYDYNQETSINVIEAVKWNIINPGFEINTIQLKPNSILSGSKDQILEISPDGIKVNGSDIFLGNGNLDCGTF